MTISHKQLIAYLASCKNLITLRQIAAGASIAPPLPALAIHQRSWDELCCSKISLDLFEAAKDDRAKARFKAVQQDSAGAWLVNVTSAPAVR